MLKQATIIVLAALAAMPVRGTEYSLKVEEKAPPEKLSDKVKSDLAPVCHQISDDKGVFFEFWFTKTLALRKFADTTAKSIGSMPEITLIGAAIVHENEKEYTDFREDPIDPGLYVMRLALQPQDGNHLGTAPFNTFAILIPYDVDDEVLKSMDPEEMVDIAREDTLAEHPPVLSLQPMENAEGTFPRLAYDEENEWHFLCLKLPAKAGEEKKALTLQLVVVGIGEV